MVQAVRTHLNNNELKWTMAHHAMERQYLFCLQLNHSEGNTPGWEALWEVRKWFKKRWPASDFIYQRAIWAGPPKIVSSQFSSVDFAVYISIFTWKRKRLKRKSIYIASLPWVLSKMQFFLCGEINCSTFLHHYTASKRGEKQTKAAGNSPRGKQLNKLFVEYSFRRCLSSFSVW